MTPPLPPVAPPSTGVSVLRGVCTACGEGRKPVIHRQFHGSHNQDESRKQRERQAVSGGKTGVTLGRTDDIERTITGYSCACPEPTAPTTPAVVIVGAHDLL